MDREGEGEGAGRGYINSIINYPISRRRDNGVVPQIKTRHRKKSFAVQFSA